MIVVRVMVQAPESLTPEGHLAVSRAQAAVKRFGEAAALQVEALSSPADGIYGAAVEPTVVVGDLVVAVGKAPLAGHLVRAIEAALPARSAG